MKSSDARFARSVKFARSILVPILVAGLFAGCKDAHQAQGHGGGMPAPTVTIAPVEQRELIEYEEFTGRLDAVESVEVRPRISGHLIEVRFQSGQMVKKGDVLFVIDPRWQKAAFDAADAELARARSRLGNVEREANRAEGLLKEKAISTEEAESRRSKLSESRAALAAAEAARTAAQLDLEFTEVKSPISGRVSRAYVTVGNHVSGVAGNNTLLTTVVSVNPIYAYADIDEATILKLNRLQRSGELNTSGGPLKVEMGLSDENDFPRHGVVESFDNRLDPNTGSIVLRSVFENPNGDMVPGMFVRIRVPASSRKPAILVPENAIGTDQSLRFVMTLSPSNTVVPRPIKLGPSIAGKRVVREGLQAGEKIIVNGLMRAMPGMPVQPKEEQAASAPSSPNGQTAQAP